MAKIGGRAYADWAFNSSRFVAIQTLSEHALTFDTLVSAHLSAAGSAPSPACGPRIRRRISHRIRCPESQSESRSPPTADCGLTIACCAFLCGFERQVLGLDLGNTMPQIGVHRGYGQHHHGDGHAHHMLRFEGQNRQRTECDQRGPIPTGSARRHAPNARSSACDGAGAYGPDAWATGLWPTPHNRQTHIEHRQEQHQNRRQNWHEHRQIDAGHESRPGQDVSHHNRSAGDEIAKQHRTGITHKQFGGMPIVYMRSPRRYPPSSRRSAWPTKHNSGKTGR